MKHTKIAAGVLLAALALLGVAPSTAAAEDTVVSDLTVTRLRIYNSGSVLIYFERDIVSDGSCNVSTSKNYVRLLKEDAGVNGALSVALAAKLSKKRVAVAFGPDATGICALRWLELIPD